MLTVYGISNCDTVRKARKWLDRAAVPYRFHDFRKDGLHSDTVAGWLAQIGHERLVNRRSTTWKTLPESAREALGNVDAQALILAHPTVVKRPVFDHDGTCFSGFDKAVQAALGARLGLDRDISDEERP